MFFMNTLILPIIETTTNKATEKINDVIITIPQKEKIDSIRTKYTDMSVKYKKQKKSLRSQNIYFVHLC